MAKSAIYQGQHARSKNTHSQRKEIEAALQAFWPRLWRFALGLCRDRADADDPGSIAGFARQIRRQLGS